MPTVRSRRGQALGVRGARPAKAPAPGLSGAPPLGSPVANTWLKTAMSMLFICFLIMCRAVEISLILFIYLDALCAGFSKKKKKCSFGETRFCFSFSEGGAEPPAGFWAPLWSDTDPQWRPGSRRRARPERRPLPPAQRPQLPESWPGGAGGMQMFGSGALPLHPTVQEAACPWKRGRPRSSARAPPASFPTCPKLNLKKSERREKKSKTL